MSRSIPWNLIIRVHYNKSLQARFSNFSNRAVFVFQILVIFRNPEMVLSDNIICYDYIILWYTGLQSSSLVFFTKYI